MAKYVQIGCSGSVETFILLSLYETLIWRMYPIKENIAESRKVLYTDSTFLEVLQKDLCFTEINRKYC